MTFGSFIHYIQLVDDTGQFFGILTGFLFCSVDSSERGVEVSNYNCEFVYDFLSVLSVSISCYFKALLLNAYILELLCLFGELSLYHYVTSLSVPSNFPCS